MITEDLAKGEFTPARPSPDCSVMGPHIRRSGTEVTRAVWIVRAFSGIKERCIPRAPLRVAPATV